MSGDIERGTVASGFGAADNVIGGTSYDTVILSGGGQEVQGGTAYDTVVSAGGTETIGSGGLAISTVVHGGSGSNEIFTIGGGKSLSATVEGDGVTEILGGIASATTFESGVTVYEYADNTSAHPLAIDTSIDAGAIMFVDPGTVTSSFTLSGGTLVLSSSAKLLSGSIAGFAGSGGALGIDDYGSFGGKISGFGAGDTVDLGGFTYKSGAETASFAEAAGGTSGVLTVSSGGSTEAFTFLGPYVTSDFTVSSGMGGATAIGFAATASATAQLHRLVDAMAGLAPLKADAAPRTEAEDQRHPDLAIAR